MQGFHPQSSAKEGPSAGSGAVLTSRTTMPQVTQFALKLPHNIGVMHTAPQNERKFANTILC